MGKIKFVGKPSNINIVALSGGIDSMMLLDFLRNANHKVSAAFFHHGTENSDDAYEFVRNYCEDNRITLHYGELKEKKPRNRSREDWWRQKRYEFLDSLSGIVATAHHLNDVAETWLFSASHGKPKVIPYKRNNVVRPLIVTDKNEITNWVNKHEVPYIEDNSNYDLTYPRNAIRHKILPLIIKYINPGFLSMVRRKYWQYHGNGEYNGE